MKNLEIIYKNGKPEGIRDKSGYLFFFRKVTKSPNQIVRYENECNKLQKLADDLLGFLKSKAGEKEAEEIEKTSTNSEWNIIWSANKCKYCYKDDVCNKLEVCDFQGRKLTPVS